MREKLFDKVKKRDLERIEEKYNKLKKRNSIELNKGFEKFLIEKSGRIYVRCHYKLKDNSQCTQRARKQGVLCNYHIGGIRKLGNKKNKELIKQENKIGIYRKNECELLKEELEEVNKKPEQELLDIKNDVKISEAVIEALKKQKVDNVKIDGKKIKNKEEAKEEWERRRLRLIRSLQYSVINNAALKKIFYDVKFSDANTVSKDLFMYVFYRYNQIIQECIPDVDLLKKISDRLKSLKFEVIEKGGKI